jgi:hypothetical protein
MDLLHLLDWVRGGVKNGKHRNDATLGVPGRSAKAIQSLRHLLEGGVEHECSAKEHAGLLIKTNCRL